VKEGREGEKEVVRGEEEREGGRGRGREEGGRTERKKERRKPLCFGELWVA
jgi:hypothetical protein